MAKYAVVLANGVVGEVCTEDPTKIFASSLAAQFESVPDSVEPGYKKEADNTFTAPPAPPAPPSGPPPKSTIKSEKEFFAAFTQAERIKLREATDSTAKDFLAQLTLNRTVDLALQETKDNLAAFVTANYLTQANVDKLNA
tara:strand:+ start:28 stop:450 length:423 start_codon:yes stop_codon:yes gene_type:complete